MPLVVSRVGVMPELVRPGVNGLFVERSVGDLAAKLSQLRDSAELRRQLSHGMQRTIRSWSRRALARNYEHKFRTILESPLPVKKHDA